MWLTLDYLSDLMYIVDMIITVHTGKFVFAHFDLILNFIKLVQTYHKQLKPTSHRKICFCI